MAQITDTDVVNSFVINRVPSQTVFDDMVDNDQIEEDQLYLVEGNYSDAYLGTATIVSTLPNGITAADVKYVKSGQVVTVYLYITRDSTTISTYVTVATGLPVPAFVPTTPGGNNYPLAQLPVAGTQGQRPLNVYVNSSGSLRANLGNAEGNYLGAFTYITSEVT